MSGSFSTWHRLSTLFTRLGGVNRLTSFWRYGSHLHPSPARTEKPQWVSCRQPGQVLTALSCTTSLIWGGGGSTWQCPLCECVSGCLFHLVLKCFHTEKRGLKWKMFGMYRFKRRPMTFFKRLLVIFLRNVMNYIIFKFHYPCYKCSFYIIGTQMLRKVHQPLSIRGFFRWFIRLLDKEHYYYPPFHWLKIT